jgi:hypothetical protein
MIGVGQFRDPFNLYDEGLWDIGSSLHNKNEEMEYKVRYE